MKKILILGLSFGLIVMSLIPKTVTQNEDISISNLTSMNIASAESSPDCCSWWGYITNRCKQKRESSIITCVTTGEKRTFYGSTGNVIGVGIFTGGTLKMEWGSSSSHYASVNYSTTFSGTKVLCPSVGNCNNCEEYNPCTH